MAGRRKRTALGSQWVSHRREMRGSPAWRALPDNARRVLDRLELEHMRHGGADNGALPCTYTDFDNAGIRRASVALAIRQCVCLGFVQITRQGGRSISDTRSPSQYPLTYLVGCGRSPEPTHEWRHFATDEDALAALRKADGMRNYSGQAALPARGKKQKAGRASEPEPDALPRPKLVVSRTR